MGIQEFGAGIVQAFRQLLKPAAPQRPEKSSEPVSSKVRQYSAAQFGRLFADWAAVSTSADSEIVTSLRTLRNRTRQVVRDNEHGKSAWRTTINNVIGQGMDFQSQIKNSTGDDLNEELNTALEEAFEEWSQPENCDVTGKLSFQDIERLVVGSWFQSGEVFIRLVKEKFGDSKIPFALQVIEADQVDEYYSGYAPNGNRIRMGVEINQWERPVAYWMYQNHPGDYQFSSKVESVYRTRIPAEEMIHLFVTERPGQTRGVPPIHAALAKLRNIGGYDDAEIIRMRLAACKMLFIETPDPESQGETDEDTQEPVVENGRRIKDFAPGMTEILRPGETAKFFDPIGPATSMDPFLAYMLRGVASALGMSYESLTKDFSRTTFSSARTALVDERDSWKILQNWVISQFHRRVTKCWLDMAALAGIGNINLADYSKRRSNYQKFIWHPRGWDWVDPLKDVQAAQTQVRAGFSTITEILAAKGKDFSKWLAQRKRELAKLKAAGIVLDTSPEVDPSRPVASGQQPAAASDEQPADQIQAEED